MWLFMKPKFRARYIPVAPNPEDKSTWEGFRDCAHRVSLAKPCRKCQRLNNMSYEMLQKVIRRVIMLLLLIIILLLGSCQVIGPGDTPIEHKVLRNSACPFSRIGDIETDTTNHLVHCSKRSNERFPHWRLLAVR